MSEINFDWMKDLPMPALLVVLALFMGLALGLYALIGHVVNWLFIWMLKANELNIWGKTLLGWAWYDLRGKK